MTDKTTPAFPCGLDDGSMQPLHYGMTIRDYFAAKALPVVPEKNCYNMKSNESDANYLARRAYEIADAMLRAREGV